MQHSDKTWIYLLEDEDGDKKIQGALEDAGYSVFLAGDFDQRDWYRFLAMPASRRLAVVDLELGVSGATEAEAGASALLNSLWPSSRSLLTVIFSKNKLPALMGNRERLLPSVVYVEKDFEDGTAGRLTAACLERLVQEVKRSEMVLPCYFPRPMNTSGEEWSRFSKEAASVPGSSQSLVESALNRSAYSALVLDDLSWACRDLGEIGAHASWISVVVLGSVARGEARPSSDIEVVVVARREAAAGEIGGSY